MKILLINKFYWQKGGSERVFLHTKKLLEQNGHQVVCFSMEDEKNNLPSSYSKYFVPYTNFQSKNSWFGKALRFIYYPLAAKNLEKLIQLENPDIAHLHNISHQLTPSILKPLKKHQIPVVQTLHDYQLICPNYRLFTKGKVCEKCKKHKYYQCSLNKCVQNSFWSSSLAGLELFLQWIFRFYKEKVDLFISPSQFLKDKVREWGIKQPINVINNFINIENFEPNYQNQDYVVCVSRLSKEKGVMTLLKAIRKLPDIKLKLIGDGQLRKEVEKYIVKKQIKNVEYLGPKYDKELFDLIKNSKFFIIPSEWYENYPMLVIEAMALGKPVLASRLGGLQEMIEENKTGWFYEPFSIKDLRSKIKQHYNESDTIEHMGSLARETVEHKNCTKRHYQLLMQAYNQVLSKENVVKLG